jgi:DNA polymerase epsilon subunit 1
MMSKPLSDYAQKKSTSTGCARKMAELLGNDLVKDKGLNVKFIICKKPIDEPISERAIPIIVFQVEPHIMRTFLKKWCKDYSMKDFDMRSLIDWEYYKERVGSSILKIVTIPAALQNCSNPFPKVAYPDWLKKRVKDLNSVFKQKKLTEFLKTSSTSTLFAPKNSLEIEDIGKPKYRDLTSKEVQILKDKKDKEDQKEEERLRIEEEDRNPPSIDKDFEGWLRCQKRFWRKFRKQRKEDPLSVCDQTGVVSMMKNFDQAFLKSTMQIIQIQQTNIPGVLKLWVRLPTNLMYPINLNVKRKFYVNSKISQPNGIKVSKTLPRQRGANKFHLYEIEQDEKEFQNNLDDLINYHLSNSKIEGVYETQIPLEYRIILELGNVVKPVHKKINSTESALGRIYSLNELTPMKVDSSRNIFNRKINKVMVYHSFMQNKHFIAVYIPDLQQFLLVT